MRHSPDLDPLVFGFAGLRALLAARATCRGWRRRCGPDRAPLWAAARPTTELLWCVIIAGDVPMLRLLDRAYMFEPYAGRYSDYAALRHACAVSDLAKVRWLVWRFALTARERGEFGLAAACANGHLAVVKRLVCRGAFRRRDLRIWYTGVIPQLCSTDRGLPVLQWLTRHFALAPTHLPWLTMLSAACAAGQLPTVRWLAEKYGVIQMCLPGSLADLAAEAGQRGQLAVLEWLSDHPVVDGWQRKIIVDALHEAGCDSMANWMDQPRVEGLVTTFPKFE